METQEKISLSLAPRSTRKKKVRALRRDGIIPGVVYGKDAETDIIQVAKKDLELVYKKMRGGASIIDADLGGRKFPVLIHLVQRDNLTGNILHIDLLKVDLKREVTVEVPLVFVGESPAEKEGKGTVGHEATSIIIKCAPKKIPAEIEVDISTIRDKRDSIYAKDLKLPEGASLGHGVSEDKVIAILAQAKAAEAASAAAEEGAVPAGETEK